jgi:phosphinothricin acetyltransferase
MDALIRPVVPTDWPAIGAIFNHYVAYSFAAYFDQPVPEGFLDKMQASHPGYPFLVAEDNGQVIGFAFLAPFHPAATMRHAATLTYFLHPDHTGHGIGARFLDTLIGQGKRMGVNNFLANISSLNAGSIKFHLDHGFAECGRMAGVGIKNGQLFDLVWVQKRF